MGSIPPIAPAPPPSHGYEAQPNVVQELQDYITEFRQELQTWMDNPTKANLQALQNLGKKIEHFLEKNKHQIFAIAQSMGWKPGGEFGYENFFKGALEAIHTLLHPPPNAKFSGVLDFINEQITQTHWFMTNKASAR